MVVAAPYAADPVFNVYTETRAPDARFLALFCLAPFALWRELRLGLRSNLVVLLFVVAVGWTLWMGASGNGRYMMILILAAGPALVACANACWPRRSLTALVAITAFACIQGTLLVLGSDFRTAGTAWHQQWISDGFPPEVTQRPVTFVSFIQPSMSWLSAFVHPESRFVGLPGKFSGTAAEPNRTARILRNSKTIIAVFGFRLIDKETGQPLPAAPAGWRLDAEQNGLSVEFDSCTTGKLHEAPAGMENFVLETSGGGRFESFGVRGILLFAAQRSSPDCENRFMRTVP
ncbi:MAG: hypothetical protein IPM02_26035 [Betaproteobacteria bacterium]|nr:hypothetical protein [Betaproteobacteria bacterium]